MKVFKVSFIIIIIFFFSNLIKINIESLRTARANLTEKKLLKHSARLLWKTAAAATKKHSSQRLT